MNVVLQYVTFGICFCCQSKRLRLFLSVNTDSKGCYVFFQGTAMHFSVNVIKICLGRIVNKFGNKLFLVN